MEKSVEIPTSDDHVIYGTLNWQEPKSDKLIIFVHGLNGAQNRHQFHNAARFFPKNGFATFRFNLYSSKEKGRVLHECSIKTHSSDVDTVVEHFRSKFKEIHLVGHSLGGPSIIYSSQKVKSLILWDSSLVLNKKDRDELWEYDKSRNLYIIKYRTHFFISKEIRDEWQVSGENMVELLKVPTKIICAGKSLLPARWKKVVGKIKVDHEFSVIGGANHSFDEEGTEEELFAQTLQWLKSFPRP